MRPEIASWLQGQVDSIRALAERLAPLLDTHAVDSRAAGEMRGVACTCNRVFQMIEEAKEQQGAKELP